MLLDLRDTIRNSKPLKYTLIGLICVPFALVGIGSYFAGQAAAPVVEVDGQPIDEQVLESAYRQQRQRVAQMFGGTIPDAFDDEAALRQQALEQLITQRVLANEVAEQRFAIGDATLGLAIRARPEFQVDGRFDNERYRQLLGGSSARIGAFEAQTRDQTAIDQFQAGVIATSFTLPSEAQQLEALLRQRRTVDALRFDSAAVEAGIEIDEDAVQARFDENADSYTFPPRAKVAWLELSAEGLAETFDVSEADARDWYDDNRSLFVTPERREASHILFEVADASDGDAVEAARAEAEAALARLEAGDTFEALAEQLSDDPGSASTGGSLGVIEPGLMVPAFEEAVSALAAEGEVSAPVTTEFGVHLIRLDAITPESGQSFEDVQDEALVAVRRDRADREFFELREQLNELVFDNPESLEPAADATGLEIATSDWVDRDTPPDEAGPVLSNPAVIDAVFSVDVLEDGNNSEPVEIGDRHVVVVRVTDEEGTRPKTLDDVREEIVAELIRERAGELLDERAETAAQALAAGEAPGEIAARLADENATDAADTIAVLEGEVLERTSANVGRAALAEIFAAPPPSDTAPSTGTTAVDGGDRLAWRLLSIETPPADAPADAADDGAAMVAAVPSVPSGADPRRGSIEFGALLAALRDRAEVDLEP